MDESDVFLRAIRVLEERGWHQGAYEGGDGSVCVMGAVNLAVGGTVHVMEWPTDVCVRFHHAIGLQPVTHWNDDPSRTYEDVVLALKRAAHGEAA